jgi:hypothetical protein
MGVMGASSLSSAFAAPADAPRKVKPAEDLIRELFATLKWGAENSSGAALGGWR